MENTHNPLCILPREKPQKFFLLFSCDLWKSTDTMKLVSVCSTPTRIKNAVIRALDEGYMRYGYAEGKAKEEMIAEFKSDYRQLDRRSVNDRLWCGFIDIIEDGADYGE